MRLLLITTVGLALIAITILLQSDSPESSTPEPRAENPLAAFEYERELTANPATGQIPHMDLLAANLAARQSGERVRAGLVASPFGEFTERGPSNVGGRTRALMYDPNVPHRVWAGGVGGGLWINPDIRTDQQWQNVDDFWQNIAISGLTYDPNNTQLFYASTGERYSGDGIQGLGIFRSTNGGATWDPNPLPATANNTFRSVRSIMVADNGNIVAAAESSIQVSTDGGTTWNSQGNATITNLRRLTDGTLLAGGLNNGRIYRSTDNGITWPIVRDKTEGRRVELCTTGTTPETVYAVMTSTIDGTVGAFERSTNSGGSWQALGVPDTRSQGWYDLVCGVNPANPDQVYVGVVRMHRTDNAGATWSTDGNWNQQHVDHHAIITGTPVGNAVPVVWGNDGGIYYASDGFAANVPIESREIGYNTTQYYSADFSPVAFSNDLYGGTQDNGTHEFDSPGIDEVVRRFGGDGAFTHVDQFNPNVIFGSTQYLNIFRSINGGDNWSYIANGGGSFVNPSDYNDRTKALFAYKNSSTVLRCLSADDADVACSDLTYSDAGTRNIYSLRVSRYSPGGNTTLLIGSYGTVLRADNADSGTQLNVVDLDPNDQLPFGPIRSVTMGASGNVILVTYSSYSTPGGQVWLTFNEGQSWSSRSGNLPGIPVRWAEFNPENFREVMVATEAGVWGTLDIEEENTVWVREPTVPITRIDQLRYRESDGQVLVATHGRGLWTGQFQTPPGIVVEAKLNLQGAIDESGGPAMRTDLADAGLLPLEQPFGESPWNYGGQESVDEIPEDVVDWVLLEIREQADVPGRKAAAFLKSDGSVLSIDGVTPLRMAQAAPGQYFIVIHQRNHLPVISPASVSLGL